MPGAYYTARIATFHTRTTVNCAIQAATDERRGKGRDMIEVVRRAQRGRLVLTLAVVTVVGAVALAQSGGGGGARPATAKPYTQWTAYGGGSHSSQYSALSQINKTNVSQLQVAWTYPVTGNVIFNPIVIDNVMYVQGSANAIVALDAATGKEIWTHPNMGGIGARGLNYWESPDRADRRLFYLNAGNLTAINAQTGETIAVVRHQRPRGPAQRAVASRPQPAPDQQPGAHLRERDHHLPAGARRRLRLDARRRAGLRRAQRQDPVDLSQHPPPGRVRLRHLARRRVPHRRRRAQLERADDRRPARHRLHPVRHRPLRFLRRQPPGREPVRQQPGGARCQDRQAAVAPAARPPRPLGLRPAAVAQAADAAPERPQRGRGGAGHQARLHLRVRSRHGKAVLPDRGTAGAADRRARRGDLADAARAASSRRRSRCSRSPRRTSTRSCRRPRRTICASVCATRATKACSRRPACRGRCRCRATTAARTGAVGPWTRSVASSTSCRRTCR